MATEGLLAGFLREIKDVTAVRKRHEEQAKAKREATATESSSRRNDTERERLPDITMDHSERGAFIAEHDDVFDNDLENQEDGREEQEIRETGGEPFRTDGITMAFNVACSLATRSRCRDRLCSNCGDTSSATG